MGLWQCPGGPRLLGVGVMFQWAGWTVRPGLVWPSRDFCGQLARLAYSRRGRPLQGGWCCG